MKTKSNKTLWIVLGIIVAVIAILSFTTCINTRTTLSTSDFDAAVFMLEDGKITKQEITDSDSQNLKDLFGKYYIKDDTEITISDVVFDSYVVNFSFKFGNTSIACTTNYSRNDSKILIIETALLNAGVEYSYTDPNAGSVWSSLLPLVGCVLIAVVFFIIMMQTQGGTKSAMNFAKTNARLNQTLKFVLPTLLALKKKKKNLLKL